MKTLFKKIYLNAKWKKVVQSKFNDFILVALKLPKGKKDTIDPAEVKDVVLQVGISSGIKGTPLITDLVKLDFTKTTTIIEDVNKITALTKVYGQPSKIFIRLFEINIMDGKVFTQGETSIKISLESLRLK